MYESCEGLPPLVTLDITGHEVGGGLLAGPMMPLPLPFCCRFLLILGDAMAPADGLIPNHQPIANAVFRSLTE
jgi:hypothetical protein